MAERGLERWDAVIANMREALEIYISLDDREMIGRSFTELTDTSNWAGRFQEATETAERGLTYFKADLNVERARLVAALGRARAAAGDYQTAQDALREALDISSRLSDPKLTADVLSTRSLVNYAFFQLREAVEDGFRSEQLDGSEAPLWERDLQLRILHWSLLYLGRPEEALRIADELEPLAGRR
jgi:tetratricopeptide (TPR) repeat protein